MKDKEIGKIYETKEYEKFKIYEWNRNINVATINKINKSVTENGWRVEPIIVNEEYGVIDGQHRLKYASENNLPIYYMVIPGLTKNDCQMMNSIRSSWLVADYIEFYAIQGNSSYTMLLNLDSVYTNFNYGVLLYALNKEMYGGGSTKKIQAGTFTCTVDEYNSAIEKLDFLNNLLPYIKKVKGRKTQFCWAILFAYEQKDIDKERLEKVIIENCNNINPPADMETALKEIERIYNYKIKKENIVYLVTEWKKQRNA